MEGKQIISGPSSFLSYPSNPPLSLDDSNLRISLFVGRPLANTLCIILVIIRMTVITEKRTELSHMIASLSGSIRVEKGCQASSQIEVLKDEYHEIKH